MGGPSLYVWGRSEVCWRGMNFFLPSLAANSFTTKSATEHFFFPQKKVTKKWRMHKMRSTNITKKWSSTNIARPLSITKTFLQRPNAFFAFFNLILFPNFILLACPAQTEALWRRIFFSLSPIRINAMPPLPRPFLACYSFFWTLCPSFFLALLFSLSCTLFSFYLFFSLSLLSLLYPLFFP